MKIEPMSKDELDTPIAGVADLSDLSDDQINAALDQYSDSQEGIEIEATTIGDGDAPEPVVDEPKSVEEPEQDPEPIAAETVEDEPENPVVEEPEAEEKEPVEFTELDEIRAMVEVSDLKSQKAEAENRHNRLLADRRAGEIAHLKELLSAREQRSAAEPGDDLSREPLYDEPGVQQEREAVVPPELQSELKEIRSERVQRALMDETVQFKERHREFFETLKSQDEDVQSAFGKDFNTALAEKTEEFHEALTGTDVKLAAVSAHTVYDSAITDAQIRMKERQLDASRKSREARQASLIDEKRASAPTVGEGAQAPEAPTNKALHELSDKELNALHRSIRY